MEYEVKYRLRGDWFWKKLKRVKADGMVVDQNKSVFQSRFFILNDESRVELPIANTVFVFPKERFISIKESMEAEINQDIKVKK